MNTETNTAANDSLHSSFSVVIPTLNGGDDLLALLERIRRQTVQPLKVVLVDSGSTDGSIVAARAYEPHVMMIAPSAFNHGGTRNLGVAQAPGECVFLFTQDALPCQDDYFERMIDSMARYKAAGVHARQRPRPEASLLVRRDLERWVSGSSTRRVASIESMSEFIAKSSFERYLTCVFDNVASLVRRSVWERIPFPLTPFGEDIEWAFRVLCEGERVVYEPEAEVIHSHERPARYQYKRTYIDHYRLYEMFGLRTIPSRGCALRCFARAALHDVAWLARTPAPWKQRCLEMLRVPRYAWASTWAQYDGAKAAALGRPPTPTRDV